MICYESALVPDTPVTGVLCFSITYVDPLQMPFRVRRVQGSKMKNCVLCVELWSEPPAL